MKKYKLVKDLPTFSLGDEFILKEGIGLQHVIDEYTDGAIVYTEATIEKFPSILADWFEEIEEQTRWKPEKFQKYYRVGSDGEVYDDVWANGSIIDNGRFEIGNCFKTKEEAERVAEYLKALAVVRGDATSKFTKGRNNFYVVYDAAYNCLVVKDKSYYIENGVFGLPYFATEEDAQRSIEQHMNEWLTIFGVKEENEAQK